MSSDKEFYVFAAVKAVFSAIPCVGGSIASLIGDIQSKRNEARLKDFLEQFANDMESRKNNIQIDYVNNPDFIDIFMNITEDAMKQRQISKRTMLKNLLVNSITIPDTKYDVTEELQRLIDILSPTHIEILNVFYEDREYSMKEPTVDTVRILNSTIERGINLTSLFAEEVEEVDKIEAVVDEADETDETTEVIKDTAKDTIITGTTKGLTKARGEFFLVDADTRKPLTDTSADGEKTEIESGESEERKIDPFATADGVVFLGYVRDLENQGLIDRYDDNVSARESGTSYDSDGPYITAKGRALMRYVTL